MSSNYRMITKRILDSQSMAGNVTSSTVDVSGIETISFQLHFTGTPTGTFNVQVTDIDATQPSFSTNFWLNVPTNPATISASGADGDVLITFSTFPYRFMRLIYTRTSGIGTVDAWYCGKGV